MLLPIRNRKGKETRKWTSSIETRLKAVWFWIFVDNIGKEIKKQRKLGKMEDELVFNLLIYCLVFPRMKMIFHLMLRL